MAKTVLITGASTGIGEASARCFAANGWNVVATMRTPEKATELATLPNVLVTRLDVQDRASIAPAIAAGIERFGQIDALINNAGFSAMGVLEALSPEKIQEQFDVNVFGLIEVTRAILPHFRANKSGLILNISSRGGLIGLPLNTLYSATKHALEGFSEALSYELASQNIIVKIIEPSGGITGTAFTERLMQERTDAPIPDYDAFVAETGTIFAKMRAARTASSDDVAQVIYTAATDGTDQLRYFAGEDVGGFLQAKRTLSDAEYMRVMREYFLPKG